jgi:hypothetical protein
LAGGSLWVAGGLRDGEAPDARLLYRLDPRSLAVQQQVELPEPGVPERVVAALAAAPDALWAGFGPLLVRVALDGGGSEIKARTKGEVVSLAFGPGGDVLYALESSADGLFVTRRHPITGALRVRSANLLGVPGGVLTPTSDGVWVSYPTGMLGALVRLRAGDLRVLAEVEAEPDSNIGTNSIAGFAVGEVLWITDGMGSTVACADPNSGAIRHVEDLDGADGLVADSAALYVASSHGLMTMAPPVDCAA